MRIFVILSLVFLGFGCATMSDVVKNKNNGITQVYPVNQSDAYKIARQVFRWEGADGIE